LSKEQIEESIDKFGGLFEVQVDREISRFTLFFNKNQLSDAVTFLSEVVLRPTFDSTQVEALKSTIYNNAATMDPYKNTVEMIHYNAFRDHYMGQPSTGIRENTYSITSEHVKQFHDQFYVGENIVVSGAGDIEASQFNELVNQHFGSVKASVEGSVSNKDKPLFTPSLMFQRDD
jgi:processing peptidase subunit beta